MDNNYFFAVSVVMLQLQLSFIHTTTLRHNCNNISHISHTTIETAKKTQLSSTNTTSFFHNCNNFFNSFIYGRRFSRMIFLKKIVAVSVGVCKRAFSDFVSKRPVVWCKIQCSSTLYKYVYLRC